MEESSFLLHFYNMCLQRLILVWFKLNKTFRSEFSSFQEERLDLICRTGWVQVNLQFSFISQNIFPYQEYG